MKIAIAQTNPTVGDIAGNLASMKELAMRAHQGGCRLVIFPELSIVGYPPRDLVLKPRFIDDQLRAIEELAEVTDDDLTIFAGFVERHKDGPGRALHNAVAVLNDGEIVATHQKSLLPTYDVFDEHRYFEPGRRHAVTAVDDITFGITICEDLWNDKDFVPSQWQGQIPSELYHDDPFRRLIEAGADVFVNVSASPFVVGKHAMRRELISRQARRFERPIIYANQVGGNDELIFDGASCVFDGNGVCVAQAKSFADDLLVFDLDQGDRSQHNPIPTGVAAVHDGLCLGLRDYVGKCGFKSALVGLSGGIDSAVVAALAARALGPERVHTVAMPSRYSSQHSIDDAKQLAENLGVHFTIIPIDPMHSSFEEHLRPHFEGRPADVTEENIQARVRGVILMALSNKFGHLLLTTGNKSELATGYCTLYGDMAGGLAVISDVPKMMVYELARHMNEQAGRALVPDHILTKPPSAELRPDQIDEDSLPPYEVLDAILARYIEQEHSTEQIIEAGFDADTVRRVVRLVDLSEYKRKQAAPGLKVTSRAFGSGRRMPIAQRYRP